MKKSLLVCTLIVMLVASCEWLHRQTDSDKSAAPVKTQICPDDPLACR